MDKKNALLGSIMVVAAFATMILTARLSPPPPPPPAPEAAKASAPVPTATAPTVDATGNATPAVSNLSAPADEAAAGPAKIVTIGNEFTEVRLTDLGGAIRNVAFKQYPAKKGGKEPYEFNAFDGIDPILGFLPDSPVYAQLGSTRRYELVSQTPNEAVFRTTIFENRVEVFRRYSVAPSADPARKTDPYVIRHETIFRNLGDQTQAVGRASVRVGTAALLDPNDTGSNLALVYHTDKDTEFIERSGLEGGWMLGMGRRMPENGGPVVWAAAKNQFFISIVTPDQAGTSTLSNLVNNLPPFPGTERPNVGLTTAVRLEVPPLVPKAETKLGMNVYVGPNEYQRLENTAVFAHDQDEAMGYTNMFFNRIFFAGIFAPLMNDLFNWTYTWVHNWGWAIIIGTLLIKIVTLPLNLAAAKSAKRMQKLAPEVRALNEKYKDNPQKRGQAMMELYKERGVNPMGGCLPMLLPLPFFVGIFAMLQAAPELRYADFLWVQNLAGPDTVARIGGFPINILPIILGVVMIVQMRLVPQPTMDSEQAIMMAKVMKWMPLFYVVICYTFSCALALYSTVNGLFMIAQQLYVNRMKDPELKGAPVGGRAAAVTAVRSVTGKKKGR